MSTGGYFSLGLCLLLPTYLSLSGVSVFLLFCSTLSEVVGLLAFLSGVRCPGPGVPSLALCLVVGSFLFASGNPAVCEISPYLGGLVPGLSRLCAGA